MIRLEVSGSSASMALVAEKVDKIKGVSRVMRVDTTPPGHSIVSAIVRPRAVDQLLAELGRLEVPDEEVSLTRIELVAPKVTGRRGPKIIWDDVVAQARQNAKMGPRRLVFVTVAGVIGCYGVVDANAILIVGAMAISPDLLPITATGVGVATRHPRIAGRGLVTLTLGMAAAAAAAALFALAQNQLGLIPSGFSLGSSSTVLGGLTRVNDETLSVALAAGIAGILALESRGSSAVGVAISVTTIPAAAYLGVAIGLGDTGNALGALAVLAANVAMMTVGVSATLVAQRAIEKRMLRQTP